MSYLSGHQLAARFGHNAVQRQTAKQSADLCLDKLIYAPDS